MKWMIVQQSMGIYRTSRSASTVKRAGLHSSLIHAVLICLSLLQINKYGLSWPVANQLHGLFYRPKRKTCEAKPPVWRTARQLQQQNVPQTPCNTTSSEDHAGKNSPVSRISRKSLRQRFYKSFSYFSWLVPEALNATMAVQRLKSRQSQSDADQSTALVSQVLNPEQSPSISGNVVHADTLTPECSRRTCQICLMTEKFLFESQ